MIVLDDVDPAKAAAAAVYACFSSMGQLCVSDERIYVMRAGRRRVHRRVRRADEGAQAGIGPRLLDATSARSPLPSQIERVKAHVDDAVAKGATVLAGGSVRADLGPNFFEPTVLTGVTPDMSCYADETFGPVVAIAHRRHRGGGDRQGERLDLRAQRLRLQRLSRAGVASRRADRLRLGEHQRGLPGHVRERRCTDGRHEGIGPRAAQWAGRLHAVHRVADRRSRDRPDHAPPHRPRVREAHRHDGAAAAHPEGRCAVR